MQADNDDWTHYLSGRYDHTALMRLVVQGIRRGLEWQTMIKTQHCPNCEATEQKLHDFRQEVSDAVVEYRLPETRERGFETLKSFMISPADRLGSLFVTTFEGSDIGEAGGYWWIEKKFRAAMIEAGLQIVEKSDD